MADFASTLGSFVSPTGGPSGGGSALDRMSRPHLIAFLTNKGYNRKFLQSSPEVLSSAAEAFKQGMSAQKWNNQWRGRAGQPGGQNLGTFNFTRSTDGGGGQQGSGIPSIDQIMSAFGGGGGGAAPVLNLPQAPNFDKLFKGLKLPKFSPKEIKNLVKSAYAPIFEALNAQLNASKLQSGQNKADIGSWYGQVADTAAQGAAADATANAAAQQSYGASVAAFQGAVGGEASPAAADIAKAGAAGAAGLAGIGEAQGNFDRNLDKLIGATKADALTRETGRASQDAMSIMMELTKAKGEQKADILSALFEGKQKNYENKLNLITTKAGFGQQTFENSLRMAEMAFNAQGMTSQAADPVELMKAAIDIQYGLIRNAKESQGEQVDPLDTYIKSLTAQGKELDIAEQLQDLQGGGSGSSGPLSGSDTSRIIKAIEDDYEAGGAEQTIAGANRLVSSVNSILRQYGLNPYGGEGKRLRLSILSQYLYLGPNGNPVGGPGGNVWK